MTLITNLYIKAYYDAVQPDNEHSALSFWSYFFKQSFPEPQFSYDRETPASSADPKRRVDGKMSYVENQTSRIMALFFHEGKRGKDGEGVSAMTAVEGQAFEACGTFMSENPQLTHIYAITTIGTEARIWKYWRNGTIVGVGVPDNSGVRTAYIEANSPDAVKLSAGIQQMKAFPPSAYATQSAVSPQ